MWPPKTGCLSSNPEWTKLGEAFNCSVPVSPSIRWGDEDSFLDKECILYEHILNNSCASGSLLRTFPVEALNSHKLLGEGLFINSLVYLKLILKTRSLIALTGLELTL